MSANESLNMSRFELGRTTSDETGVRLFSLRDPLTGIKISYPEPNSDVDYISAVAWLASNSSREGKSFEECFRDLREMMSQINPETGKPNTKFAADKFGNVFANFGHASVGDMALLPLLLDNIPASLAYRLFNATSLGAGQEWSTRYGRKDEFGLPGVSEIIQSYVEPFIEQDWLIIQGKMAASYAQFFTLLRDDLDTYLTLKGYDTSTPKANNTLNARTLDVARMFLPFGVKTKQAYIDGARDWVRMAGIFRQSTDPFVKAFGEHITAMMLIDRLEGADDVSLHLENFTKYAEGTDTARQSTEKVARFILEKLASQGRQEGIPFDQSAKPSSSHILNHNFHHLSDVSVYSLVRGAMPQEAAWDIERAIRDLSDIERVEISKLAFAGHNHHDFVGPAYDVRGLAISYESALAYLRDINRHRSFGRHVLGFSCEDQPIATIERGANLNFPIHNAEYWVKHAASFDKAMQEIFTDIEVLIRNVCLKYGENAGNAVLQHILPLGAQMEMILSAPAQQWAYMTSLRIGLGGDFGYRQDVWNMLKQVRNYDPGLAAMSSHLQQPDVNSPEQILGRS